MFWLLFDFRGRTRRSGWYLSQFACVSLAIFWMFAPQIVSGRPMVMSFSSKTVYPKGVDPFDMGPWWSMEGLAVFGFLFIWIYMAATVKRFHDLGRSGFYALIALIPTAYWLFTLSGCKGCTTLLDNPTLSIVMLFLPSIIGMWLMATCGMQAGEPHENQWGPPPGTPGRLTNAKDPLPEAPSRFAKFDDKYFEDYARQLANTVAQAEASEPSLNIGSNRPTFGKR